ncbi:MAG: hypothetical protein ACFE85_08400 [Candidatus Hodarchaeota archaeon]
MVFKNISRIKSALPEVVHIVMFYNNGTVFQTTFEQEINVPKLGENVAEVLNHIKRVYEFCNYSFESYKKIIFETDNISVIILKLGEDSNIALFFKKEEEKDLKLSSIRRYITRIEELIDMDEKELILHEILKKEENVKKSKEIYQNNQQIIEKLQEELAKIDQETLKEDFLQKEKEINIIIEENTRLNQEMEKINNEIEDLKNKIKTE